MRMTSRKMNAPVGICVNFETAPVSKFHAAVNLVDPADPYRMAATITMPEDRKELWLVGVIAAFRRICQCNYWSLKLNYSNTSQYFNIDQIKLFDKCSPGFSIDLYEVPKTEMDRFYKPSVSVVSASAFKRMYDKARRAEKQEVAK